MPHRLSICLGRFGTLRHVNILESQAIHSARPRIAAVAGSVRRFIAIRSARAHNDDAYDADAQQPTGRELHSG